MRNGGPGGLVHSGVSVVKMYYMNTERDNFHDWARDKPETSFSALQPLESRNASSPPVVRWGRMLVLAALAVAVGFGLKFLSGN